MLTSGLCSGHVEETAFGKVTACGLCVASGDGKDGQNSGGERSGYQEMTQEGLAR